MTRLFYNVAIAARRLFSGITEAEQSPNLRACPRCGCRIVDTSAHSLHAGEFNTDCVDAGYVPPGRGETSPLHFHVTCRRCRREWIESAIAGLEQT